MKRLPSVFLGIAIGIILTTIYFLIQSPKLDKNSLLLPTIQPNTVKVSISGEVNKPGQYKLPFGSKLSDLVVMADGLTPFASPEADQLGLVLVDGQSYTIRSRSRSSENSIDTGIVNINTATAAELETLPGIGPAIAKEIIAFRDVHGRFDTIESLDRVPGIGPVMLGKLKGLIVFE